MSRSAINKAFIDDLQAGEPRAMTDEATEDVKAFGADVWIYCRQHLRPHQTGWCTVHVDQKVPLEVTSMEAAYAECRRRKFTIYSDKR